MEFFDSHAHYDDNAFLEDRDEIITTIYRQGITKCVSCGYGIKSSIDGVELSKKYEHIYTTCGISPNDIQDYEKEGLDKIKHLASTNNKVVAIGEIGLDYYWNKENCNLQKELFIKQIEIANKLNLPIVIHSRDAISDTIEILKEHKVKCKGIFHCCPLNKEFIKEGLKLGFYISFAGPVTFKNSKNAKEVVDIVPEDKILIETDSPYLTPEPKRGQRNDSRNVKFVAQKIAEFKKVTLEEIANITYKNAKNIFRIG